MSTELRRPLVAANWKMHKTVAEADQFVEEYLAALPSDTGDLPEVFLCPAYTALRSVVEHTLQHPIEVAAQNMHELEQGAFTGEVSAQMLAELGVKGVILGHSERRQYFGENDPDLQHKVVLAIETGLTPILCVGESEEERDSGETERKLRQQVFEDVKLVESGKLAVLVIAYEPIWAIGTGRTATTEQAQEAIGFIRALVGDRDRRAAKQIRILYGGSVKPDNVGALMKQPDIDGALVGGASLDPRDFAAIVRAVRG